MCLFSGWQLGGGKNVEIFIIPASLMATGSVYFFLCEEPNLLGKFGRTRNNGIY